MKLKYVFCFLLISSFALFCFSGCKNSEDKETPTAALQNESSNDALISDSLLIAKPITVDNLTLYPVVQKTPKLADDFISLAKGLENKTVIVKEVNADSSDNTNGNNVQGNSINNAVPQNNTQNENNDSENNSRNGIEFNNFSSTGTVNAVDITNNSDKKLYIIAGEVIIGGKQDRMITVDVLIEPNSKKRVDVCCVEQGRWSTRANSQGYEFTNVAKANVQMGIKLKTLDNGTGAQHAVWEEVSRGNSAINNSNTSDTYNKVISHNEKQIEKANKQLNDELAKIENVCGFIVCINGKIKGVEFFASPSILALYEEKLLNSFILDALLAKEKWNKEETISNGEINKYFNEFVKNKDNAVKAGEAKFVTTGQIGFNSDFYFKLGDSKETSIHSTSFANEPNEKPEK